MTGDINTQPARTLLDKLWAAHEVKSLGAGRSLLYIDRVFLHERTGSIALQSLATSGRALANPKQVFCTMDHIVDTFVGRGDETLMPSGTDFIEATRKEANAAGITLFDVNDPDQGIAHVISPELGIALPGLSLVCPDSHTCTLGALGALAWGIGSTDAEHAMATQTLSVQKPKSLRVTFNGQLQAGVTSKDMILHLIGEYGTNAASGYAVEFAGSAIRALEQEARFTLCNMAVEFSAFTGFIAPDDITFQWLEGRDYAPKGEQWQSALSHWQTLNSDEYAVFDKEIVIDASMIEPTVSWGTNPHQVSPASGSVPAGAPSDALAYMGLTAGQKLNQIPVDAAFIGSCTNSRLSDLRAAGEVVKGKHIAPGVSAVVVPGSGRVKRAAEDEGLDKIFTDAGFEWREPGCSMCFYAGGETFGEGKRVISSTNRNFQGRQGPKVKTHLASPATVAASAILGRIGTAAEARLVSGEWKQAS